MFTSAFPIISTPDLGRALAFYRDGFGGRETYRFPPGGDPAYVALAIGSSQLGLAQDASAASGVMQQRFALWVYAEDCDRAVERLRASGAAVLEPPADQPWGERVARVHDPDGNLVLIGSPPPA
jgi:lactoylglutathione lyase